MPKKVTLADLSRETGLSQATISMILARRPDVSFSESTIDLVRSKAQALGYTPALRRASALFGHKTIIVICPFVLNHYYSAVVQSLQAAAAGLEYNVLVCATYNSAPEEARLLRMVAGSEIGGLIFVMMPHSISLLRKLCRLMPVVVLADRDGESPASIMELHNYEAGKIIATHLAKLGHRNIICISTPLSSSVPARVKRYEGLKDSWQKLCPEGHIQLFTDFASPSMLRDNIQLERYIGQETARLALEQDAHNSTAFVALNDMLAYGVMDLLTSLGKKIPDDYSICGCDNDFPSDLPGVRLTSVEHFMAKNAREAFNLLHRKIAGEKSPEIFPVRKIQPELVLRESTSRPAH